MKLSNSPNFLSHNMRQKISDREDVGLHYLKEGGMDVDRAVRLYFEREGAEPDRGPIDQDGFCFEPPFKRAEEQRSVEVEEKNLEKKYNLGNFNFFFSPKIPRNCIASSTR